MESSPLMEFCAAMDARYPESPHNYLYQNIALKIDRVAFTQRFLDEIKFRKDNGLNFLITTEGEQGQGKSLFDVELSVRIGTAYEFPFVLERDIFVNPMDLDFELRKEGDARRTFMRDEMPKRKAGIGSGTADISLKDWENVARYCVTGKTLISIIENNTLVKKTAQKLCGKEFITLSFDFENKKVVQDEAVCVKESLDLITRITLRNGKIIEVNEEHPFFVRLNGKISKIRTKNLKIGDDLFCRKGVSCFDNPLNNKRTRKKLSNVFKNKWKRGDYLNRKKLRGQAKQNVITALLENHRKARESGKYHKCRWTRKQRKIMSVQKKEMWAKRREEFILKLTGLKHKPCTIERKKKLSEMWKNPDYVSNQIKKRIICPNKSEQKLEGFLNKFFKRKYKFVGDGKKEVAGKFPDFINEKNKRIIELFGEPFHTKKEAIQRKRLFKKQGYLTLIIWSDELNNCKKVIRKVGRFNEN